MSSDQHIWRIWAQYLHKWGLAGWAASLLEAAGPLNILAAQVIYMVQPIADTVMPDNHWQALSEMLEDTKESQRFTSLLREVDIQ
jgi:EamA domain-containing membrane protein RarD